MEDLKFICPVCGSHGLYAVEEEITGYTEISSISADGWIDYGCQEFDDCDLSEAASYHCRSCAYELKDESGRSVIGEEQLFDWLKGNNDNHKDSEENDS